MTDRHRLRWLIFAVLGVVLAVLVWVGLVSASVPESVGMEVAPMRDLQARDRKMYRHPPEPQPVPSRHTLDRDGTDVWDGVQVRADWVDGAVVACQIGDFIPDNFHMTWESDLHGRSVDVTMDGHGGLNLTRPVDMMSRLGATVVEGRIVFTVLEPSGSVLVGIPVGPDSGQYYTGELSTKFLNVRWSGAVPGTTVGCDGVWEQPAATVSVTVLDKDGKAYVFDPDAEFSWQGRGVFVSGCGHMFWFRKDVPNPVRFSVPAEPCDLRLEHRNTTFPLIVSRGKKTPLHLSPGEHRQVTLRAPPMPPLYFPPDFDELAAISDLAAMRGSASVSDVLDELMDDLADGNWEPDRVQERVEDLKQAVEDDQEVER